MSKQDNYDGPNRRQEQWHLKREVNLAHLFTTIAAVVSVATFLANQDKRLALVEAAIARQDQERLENRVDMKEIKDDIKKILARLK